EEVLGDIALPGITAGELDHSRQVHDGRIRIAVALTGPEGESHVRHHRYKLLPLGGLEWFPRLATGPRPGARLQSRTVRQQVANCHVGHRPEGIVDPPQLGNEFGGWLVELDATETDLLHHCDGGEGLGDRTPVPDGAAVGVDAPFTI